MPEPPLNDGELRMLRGMIDEYVSESNVHAWLRHWRRVVTKVVVFVSAVAVTIAAVEEIVRSLVGG